MQIIGIVGTAKNTGKTTALTSVLSNLRSRNLSVAVTSIGYDGEDLDNLTFLPKPRITLEKDTLIATSSLTLDTAKLKYELLSSTGIFTPLGEILIAKVTEAGKIVVAGPNNIRDLKKIITAFKSINPDLLFVDGAMNRMAPMYLVDKLIFSTGASRNISIDLITDEIQTIASLFSKEVFPQYAETASCMLIKNDKITETGIPSLLSEKDLSSLLLLNADKFDSLVLKGIFSPDLLKELINDILKKRKEYKLGFLEPFRLLLSMDTICMSSYQKLFPLGIDVFFAIMPKLIAVTVNSFYPKYENFHFLPGYIDKDELKEKVSSALSEPVIDIFSDGSEKLSEIIIG